jgi:hypothetical protein
MRRLELIAVVFGFVIFSVVMKSVGPTVLAMDLRYVGLALGRFVSSCRRTRGLRRSKRTGSFHPFRN